MWPTQLGVLILTALSRTVGSDAQDISTAEQTLTRTDHTTEQTIPLNTSSNPTTAEHNGLFVVTRDKVYKIDLETSEKSVISEGFMGGTALDYDLEKRVLVVSDVNEDCLYKVDINTGNKTVLATGKIGIPDGVAVDWIYGNVYWTDTGTDTISVVSLDGTLRKVLFDTDLTEPRAIVVNPLEGWMYWSDWGRTTIERSGMDGTQRSTIVTTGGWPNGLALDFDSRKIYWIDAKLERICMSGYDGSNVEVVLGSTPHPFALDLFENWMYWDDWQTDKIYKANKLNGETKEVAASGIGTPMGIQFIHSSKQPKGRNYCEEGAECSHLCLPAPRISEDSTNFTCACPDGLTLTDDQKNCTVEQFPGISTTEQTSTPDTNTSSPIGCGGNLTFPEGVMHSPEQDQENKQGITCTWRLIAPEGYRIRVTFLTFYIDEISETCNYDYISVEEEDGSNLGRFCVTKLPPEITSLNSTLTVTFHANITTPGVGFKAKYEFFKDIENCGGNFTGPNTTISSPGFPVQYPQDVTCTWRLIAPEGYRIRLEFLSFNVEANSETCFYDYVLVQQADDSVAGRFCGSNLPPLITSSNNTLAVKFHADSTVAKEGFKAQYQFFNETDSCGGNLTFPEGVISSPRHPQQYPHGLNCTWRLMAPEGYRIRLEFLTFELEATSAACNHDRVLVEEADGTDLGRFCGSKLPPAIVTFDNILTVTFYTDSTIARDGFTIKYQFLNATETCGGILVDDNNSVLSSPRHPQQSSSDDVTCTWRIIAPKRHSVRLTFLTFDVELSPTCKNDYVSVQEGLAFRKFCGTELPPVITSSSNILMVTFHADNEKLVQNGFTARYEFLHETESCEYAPAFFCTNGRCIKKAWICDGDDDCRDNSDEENCHCPYNKPILCDNGEKCISGRWLCDGDKDCTDNSDEMGCATPTTRTTSGTTTTTTTTPRPTTTTVATPLTSRNSSSPRDQCRYHPAFFCANGRCTKKAWRCDGDNDCGDNSDERNCGRCGPIAPIPCDSGEHCIASGWLCDGDKDCGDNSDEQDCVPSLGTISTSDPATHEIETETSEIAYETVTFEIETEAPLLSTTSHAAQHLMNGTSHGTGKAEGDGTTKTTGIILGMLLLIAMISMVGFFMYKKHLRRNIIMNFDNPVYLKKSEESASFESLSRKESVTLTI